MRSGRSAATGGEGEGTARTAVRASLDETGLKPWKVRRGESVPGGVWTGGGALSFASFLCRGDKEKRERLYDPRVEDPLWGMRGADKRKAGRNFLTSANTQITLHPGLLQQPLIPGSLSPCPFRAILRGLDILGGGEAHGTAGAEFVQGDGELIVHREAGKGESSLCLRRKSARGFVVPFCLAKPEHGHVLDGLRTPLIEDFSFRNWRGDSHFQLTDDCSP